MVGHNRQPRATEYDGSSRPQKRMRTTVFQTQVGSGSYVPSSHKSHEQKSHYRNGSCGCRPRSGLKIINHMDCPPNASAIGLILSSAPPARACGLPPGCGTAQVL